MLQDITHPCYVLKQLSLLVKDDLGTYGMNAHISIHELSDVNVDGHTGEHIGVVAAQVLLINEEVDHVAHGKRGGFFEIGTEAHADIAGGRFGSGPK